MRQAQSDAGFRLAYDRYGDYLANASLTRPDRSGHFTPVQRPREFAAAVAAAVRAR
jgi:pimeloyl-ACP methyl ester carboxylesterase